MSPETACLITLQKSVALLSRCFIASLFCLGTAAAADAEVADHVGEISAADLLSAYSTFQSEYQNYSPDANELQLIRVLQRKEVTVLFGTWCHDSEREVPRLLKLLSESGVELDRLTLFAVDRDKSDPEGYAANLGLRYTPTIIVSGGGEELARIIEKPERGLAQDLQAQLAP